MAAKKAASKSYKKASEDFKSAQTKGAAKSALEELFNDFHRNRKQVYLMNFFRGIFFGLGSVLGGTLLIAIIVWTLSLFSDTWLGPLVKSVMDAIQQQSA